METWRATRFYRPISMAVCPPNSLRRRTKHSRAILGIYALSFVYIVFFLFSFFSTTSMGVFDMSDVHAETDEKFPVASARWPQLLMRRLLKQPAHSAKGGVRNGHQASLFAPCCVGCRRPVSAFCLGSSWSCAVGQQAPRVCHELARKLPTA